MISVGSDASGSRTQCPTLHLPYWGDYHAFDRAFGGVRSWQTPANCRKFRGCRCRPARAGPLAAAHLLLSSPFLQNVRGQQRPSSARASAHTIIFSEFLVCCPSEFIMVSALWKACSDGDVTSVTELLNDASQADLEIKGVSMFSLHYLCQPSLCHVASLLLTAAPQMKLGSLPSSRP